MWDGFGGTGRRPPNRPPCPSKNGSPRAVVRGTSLATHCRMETLIQDCRYAVGAGEGARPDRHRAADDRHRHRCHAGVQLPQCAPSSTAAIRACRHRWCRSARATTAAPRAATRHTPTTCRWAPSWFESMAALQDDAVAVMRVGDVVERIRVMRVSAGRDARPARRCGRAARERRRECQRIADGGDQPQSVSRVRVRRHGGRQVIHVAGQSHTIVGVAPQRFQGLELGRVFDLWTPPRRRRRAPRSGQSRVVGHRAPAAWCLARRGAGAGSGHRRSSRTGSMPA